MLLDTEHFKPERLHSPEGWLMFAKVPKSGARCPLRFSCFRPEPVGSEVVLTGSWFSSPPITSNGILLRLFEVNSCVLTGKWSYSWSLPHRAAGKTP